MSLFRMRLWSFTSGLVLQLPFWLAGSVFAQESKVIEKGRAATALVISGTRFYPAVCVHPNGLFISSAGASAPMRIILNPNTPDQKEVMGRQVYTLGDGLTLVRAYYEKGRTFSCLEIAPESREKTKALLFGIQTKEVWTSGGKEAFPAISQIPVELESSAYEGIQQQIKGRPSDANAILGPLVDEKGMLSGFAGPRGKIPVAGVMKLLEKPITMLLPTKIADPFSEIDFGLEYTTLDGTPVPGVKVLMHIIAVGRKNRALELTSKDDGHTYTAKFSPVEPITEKEPLFLVGKLEYSQGVVVSAFRDKTFKVGDRTVKLSEVSQVSTENGGSVTFHQDEKTLAGRIDGLDSTSADFGNSQWQLELRGMRKGYFSRVHPEDMVAWFEIVIIKDKQIAQTLPRRAFEIPLPKKSAETKAIPASPDYPFKGELRGVCRFERGYIEGDLEPREFRFNGKAIKLSELLGLNFPSQGIRYLDGRISHGKIEGLDETTINFGGEPVTLASTVFFGLEVIHKESQTIKVHVSSGPLSVIRGRGEASLLRLDAGNAAPDSGWLSLPALTPDREGGTLRGETIREEDLTITKIDLPSEAIQNGLIWGARQSCLYAASAKGVIRRISFPDFAVRRIDLGSSDVKLAVAKGRLLVLFSFEGRVLSLDADSLALAGTYTMENASSIAATPSSNLFYLGSEEKLVVYNVESKLKLREYTASGMVEAARVQKKKLPVFFGFSSLFLTQDGQFLFAGKNRGESAIFQTSEGALFLKDQPAENGHIVSTCVDPAYFVMQHQRTIGIFSRAKPLEPILTFSDELKAVEPDKAGQKIYGVGSGGKLIVFGPEGLKTKEYTLKKIFDSVPPKTIVHQKYGHVTSTITSAEDPRVHMLLYAGGNNLLVPGGTTLLWVQFPSSK